MGPQPDVISSLKSLRCSEEQNLSKPRRSSLASRSSNGAAATVAGWPWCAAVALAPSNFPPFSLPHCLHKHQICAFYGGVAVVWLRRRQGRAMDPILAQVQRLWNLWDVRILVLISLILQFILSIFGNRRKYISSLWFNVLIWSAYLMADWVATVALGKLSNPLVNNDNNDNGLLRVIWAPLLMLHLGGPDAITAYSLEDNQLWLRHLWGLGAQLVMTFYVIVMSWRHSWFSFMSFPALVAGAIKYGERTWILKSVSGDKSGDIVPYGYLGDYNTTGYLGDYNTTEGAYMRVLYIAHRCLKEFKSYVEYYNITENVFPLAQFLDRSVDIKLFWNALEVEMGLMYDLLYTKTVINHTKAGWILRGISFTCTMTVSVGLFIRLIFMREDHQEKWDMVDLAITVVLLVGALVLEIYAVIVLYLSFDWTMLWIVKADHSSQATKLRQRFPFLFHKKRYWSKMMAQFDLLGFCIKEKSDHQKPIRRILGSMLGNDYQDKLNGYLHKTVVDVHPLLYTEMLDYCGNLGVVSNRIVDEEDSNQGRFAKRPFQEQIIIAHIATEVCDYLERESATFESLEYDDIDPSSWENNREISKTLSRYLMYLLFMCPSLLPLVTSKETTVRDYTPDIGDAKDVSAACRYILERRTFDDIFAEDMTRMRNVERWKILKFMWLRMLCYAASKGQKNEHLQQLRQGGELLTFVWFFLPQSRTLGLNPELIGPRLDKWDVNSH
ncbi:hypothetical protein RHSIM_Rhsim05G0197800 [Rhododendron simsii]|uniref:DUF4220 domain-containing protein n=1 Tax=Rhododendron simsii TaxID=118357 RepID=A0A834LPS5_RHOSS|nr:hypothetical protein RHSIM_Rhsim05G0197800 [Rhododendron simsii]